MLIAVFDESCAGESALAETISAILTRCKN